MLLTLKVFLGAWGWKGSMCLRVCAQSICQAGLVPWQGRRSWIPALDPGSLRSHNILEALTWASSGVYKAQARIFQA